MDTDLLKSFVAIVETKSFTAAARQVGRTQSAVSLQMKRLEDLLGRPIFARGSSSVTMTEHGVLLLSHARRILSEVNQTEAAFQRGSVEGVVVLGLPDDYAPRILAEVLRSFTELYPRATINLVIDESRSLVKRLAEGSVDLAFITEGEGPVSGGPILFRDSMVWVVSATGDAHQRDPLPIAMWDETDTYAQRMTETLKQIKRDYRVAVISRSMTGLRGAVTAGIAVTAMMKSSVVYGMRILDKEDGFPPLAELSVRLERAHLRKLPVIDRLEAHLLSQISDIRSPDQLTT